MADKKVIAGVAGVAVVGILSYLGYKLVRALDDWEIDWEGASDDYDPKGKLDS